MNYDPAPTLEPTGEFLQRRGLAYRDLRILVTGATPSQVADGAIAPTFRLDIQPDADLACALIQKNKQAVAVVNFGSDPIPSLELLERLGELHPACIKVALVKTNSTDLYFAAVQRGTIDILLNTDASEEELELTLAAAVERSVRERASTGLLKEVSDKHAELTRRMETTSAALFDATERLARMNVADRSTGLYGMAYFQNTWRREMARSIRYGRPLSLMVMDLDRPATGEAPDNDALRATGTFLLESIRDVDCVARFGSEGFCIILPECGKADAVELAERLREAFVKKSIEGPEGDLSLTVAVVASPEDESSAGAMIRLADSTLRTAMANGKDQVVSG